MKNLPSLMIYKTLAIMSKAVFLRSRKVLRSSMSSSDRSRRSPKKVFSLLPKFFVEVHGQEAIVLENHFTFFKARYSISAEGIDVDGNWWDMDFVVNRNGKRIAEIHKKWISWGDTYEVVIYEEDLDDLIIALVVAIDRVKADDAAASSSASS